MYEFLDELSNEQIDGIIGIESMIAATAIRGGMGQGNFAVLWHALSIRQQRKDDCTLDATEII